MTTLLELLRDGYFPKELPPPFTTTSFANFIDSNYPSLPRSFRPKKFGFKKHYNIALNSEHNIARIGTLRRRLGIPNPITHFRLCEEIADHWYAIDSHIQGSQLSVSKPIKDYRTGGYRRALITTCGPSMTSYLRTKYRMGAKYLLMTDIAEFYHSIYTHSIPWAFYGKTYAKTHRNDLRLTGNRLDKFTMNCQDGQTIGIPIGPDTSLVLAEILLTRVDRTIAPKLKQLKGFRQIDDYELCFSKLKDAEIALNEIESALSDFELHVNPKKTKIEPLPLALENYWATWLRNFKLGKTKREQRTNLISYFSRAFEFANENPELSILRYAIARLRSTKIDSGNWQLFQNLLLQCVSSEPGTLPYVLELYVRFYNQGYNITTDQLEEVLNSQIQYHAPLGHGSEVAWSLWGAIAFQVSLHSASASAVSNMEDSIVSLLALDAEQHELFLDHLNKRKWTQYMTKEGLDGEQWLLSYEANIKGWLPSLRGGDHVADHKCFKYLKANNVQFYDISLAAKVIPCATSRIPTGYCL